MGRFLCCCFVLGLLSGSPVLLAPATAHADGEAMGGAALQKELETGLKATRDEEKAFLTLVVSRVDAGLLPLATVKSTYLWARKKYPRDPYIYFERGLKLRVPELAAPT